MFARLKRSGLIALLALTAAGAAPFAARAQAANGPDAAGPATFRIGMIAREHPDPGVEGLSVIRSAYARALGVEVEVFVARDYAALIEAHLAGRLDYAVYSTAAYAAASIRCECLRPVAAPLDSGGAAGFRAALIVRPGADEETARIAIGPADSLATRLVPLASWPQAVAAAAEGRLVEAPSAGAAVSMFARGEVDGFFGWLPVPAEGDADDGGGSLAPLRAAGLGDGDYEIGWRSGPLRYGPHAVRADMPAGRVETLARMLTGAAAEAPELLLYLDRHHGGGFAEAGHDDYATVIAALTALGQGSFGQ